MVYSVESLREIKEYTNHTFTFVKDVSDYFQLTQWEPGM